MDNKEIDFYSFGMKKTKEIGVNLEKMAEEIGLEYGDNARLEFECGAAVFMQEIANNSLKENIEKYIGTRAKNIESSEDLRNNSYFGYSGESKQYIDGEYNEPKKFK